MPVELYIKASATQKHGRKKGNQLQGSRLERRRILTATWFSRVVSVYKRQGRIGSLCTLMEVVGSFEVLVNFLNLSFLFVVLVTSERCPFMLNFYCITFYLIGQSLSYRQVIGMGLHKVNVPKVYGICVKQSSVCETVILTGNRYRIAYGECP